MNFLIRIIFYLRYFILKQGNSFLNIDLARESVIFESHSWDELDTYDFRELEWGGLKSWNKHFPWQEETDPQINYNTYGIFSQQYGKFYFKATLDGIIDVNGWPAIWLLEIGKNNSTYFEIDIELFWNCFGFTTWSNPNGGQELAKVQRSMFKSVKLWRSLQDKFHLYLIDWNKKRVKFYIDGILASRFKNDIHIPMQVILSKLTMQKTLVTE